jgi:molybdenum-dependent DNA-binding transcriptional regulator ModE
MKETFMNVQQVREAIEQGGSIRAAAKLLGKSYNTLQWWLARHGYEVQHKAVLVERLAPVTFNLTSKGKQAIEEDK